MAVTAAELQVRVTSDVAAALSGLNRVNKAVSGTGSFLSNAASTALGFVGGMVGMNAVAGVVGGVTDAVFGMNSTLEGSQIALETMLGSSKAAGDQLNRLKQFAQATPFELPQLLEAQQRLLAFGFKVGDVIPLMTNLGDAAAGLNLGGGGLSRLVTAIGQIQAKGKVQGDELLQLTEAGIPGLQLLATHLGKSTEETQKLVSAGKVKSDVFLAAFKTFAQANFGGLMQKQSRTFEGAVSNIKDAVGFGLAEAFFPLFDLIRSLAVDLADFLQTPAFTDFVQRVKSGIASLVQPFGTFLVMVGNIAKAHGLNLFQAGLVALQVILGQVFGPKTAQSFNDLITTIQTLANFAAAKLPQAFAWLAERLPGWIELGAAKLQEFAGWLETGAPVAVDAVKAKFEDWRDWIVDEIPKMVGRVAAAIEAIRVVVFATLDATMAKIEDMITHLAGLPVIGAALQPAADAIAAQRAALPGAAANAGNPLARAAGAAINIAFNGPINASNTADVLALAQAVADAVTAAAEQAEPAPPMALAGVVP